jgi:HEAT repeat protein
MRILALLTVLLIAAQDDAAVDRLLLGLDAETPAERERAQQGLLDVGERVLPRLKAAEARATGEPKARLGEVVREIEIRKEEAVLAKAGFPFKLAREVPRFRERFYSSDETVVLECLKESFVGRKRRDPESDDWMNHRAGFDSRQVGEMVHSVLDRAKETPLKIAALRLAAAHDLDGLEDVLVKLVDDPSPLVRRAVLESASGVSLTGAEEAFEKILKKGTEEERGLAFRGLRRMKSRKAKKAILVALEDSSATLRADAIHELCWAEEESAIPAIRRLLKDPNGNVRYSAVWALQNYRAFDALDDILALQDDPDRNVRNGVLSLVGFWADPRGKDAVLRALGKRGDEDAPSSAISSAASLRLAEALPVLVKLLAADDPDHADRAANAIAEIGPGPHEAELLAMVRGKDVLLRRRALLSLSTAAPSADVLAAELKAIADPEPSVRQAAVGALAKARGPEVLPALRTALKDGALRDEVLKALVESPQPGAGRMAIEFLDDPDEEVVERALEVIERQQVVEAVPKLEKLMEHPSRRIGGGAASALYRVAGSGGFPAMLRALDRASDETRERIWNYFELDPDDNLVETAIQWVPRLEFRAKLEALQVLTNYPSAKSTAFLAKMIEDPKAFGRSQAIRALTIRGNAEGLKAAREEARTERGQNRVSAAGLVVEYGEPDEETVKVLVDGIRVSEDRGKYWLLRPLVERRLPEAKPLLIEGLRQKEWYQRDYFAKGMANYPRGTFDAELRAMAADLDESARRGAARGLTYVETADRLELLRKLLGDAAVPVRSEAVMAFWVVKPREVPAELESRLDDPSDEVRKWAVDVVGKLDPSLLKGRAEALLADRSAGVREKAGWAVARGKIQVSPVVLERLLEDPEGSVRSAAASAIGALGHLRSAEKLIRRSQDDPDHWVRSNAAHALLDMGHERGMEIMRSLLHQGPPVFIGNVTMTLMERADRPSVPTALAFVSRSSQTLYESNRTLLAMNAFTQPELYNRAKEARIDLCGWKGTEREWLGKLGEALGLTVEIDPGIPEFTVGGRKREGYERPVLDELTSIGFFLNGAAVLEPGRLRVMHRRDALARWERWHREGK